jgi:hypothetical protein
MSDDPLARLVRSTGHRSDLRTICPHVDIAIFALCPARQQSLHHRRPSDTHTNLSPQPIAGASSYRYTRVNLASRHRSPSGRLGLKRVRRRRFCGERLTLPARRKAGISKSAVTWSISFCGHARCVDAPLYQSDFYEFARRAVVAGSDADGISTFATLCSANQLVWCSVCRRSVVPTDASDATGPAMLRRTTTCFREQRLSRAEAAS